MHSLHVTHLEPVCAGCPGYRCLHSSVFCSKYRFGQLAVSWNSFASKENLSLWEWLVERTTLCVVVFCYFDLCFGLVVTSLAPRRKGK